MKIVFAALGLLATGLAVLGAILPGLPTTPFLIFALWAFARSNRRLHAWLKSIPLLQSALHEAERFEKRRSIRLSVKLFAFVMAWSSAALTAFVIAPDSPIIIALVLALVVSGTVFLLIVRTG